MALPYPTPTSAAVTAVMRANRKRDTKPELRLRSALHRRGIRYRLGLEILTRGVRVTPDLLFPRHRVAVFVDGCWWHRCPDHGVTPRTNTHYWLPKLAGNVERDQRVDAALKEGGWLVVRVWEHEEPGRAAASIASLLGARRASESVGAKG
jgi:DNA mismatch endonuclease (patch repair protein)